MSGLPKTSDVKAIDVWILFSMAIIFASLIELALVGFLYKNEAPMTLTLVTFLCYCSLNIFLDAVVHGYVLSVQNGQHRRLTKHLLFYFHLSSLCLMFGTGSSSLGKVFIDFYANLRLCFLLGRLHNNQLHERLVIFYIRLKCCSQFEEYPFCSDV